ncbi:putative Hef-like homing endonuclease [Campylobacter phage vB_CjeM_Los1]|uniref:Putative Hef-like homing endonuclease n=1 Tax=Campylobacter phage vB_CjeM_Los1 TaxID=1904491 RepID=A0A1D8EX54_9CAUD|nr:homing endonuclease [Campylobacter phage vB_CjeM_Los1]AOT25839.1 putative Hef-like homing endonuclease [Campylobacter phage vB_CjeM_Los1]
MDKIEYLKSLGYTPVSSNLTNNLEVLCHKCNNIFKRSFYTFKNGSVDCPNCQNIERLNYLKSIGFEAVDLYNVKCLKGHIFKRRFSEFKNGATTCPICIDNEKQEFIKGLGYIIKDIKGDNFTVECQKGHVFNRVYSSFRSKNIIFCPECKNNEKILFLNSVGLKKIKSDGDKMTLQCSKGHTFVRRYCDIKRGSVNCPECIINMKEEYLKSIGFTLIKTNVVKCSKGHIFNRSYSDFVNGSIACPTCQKENILNFIESNGLQLVSLGKSIKLKCQNDHIFTRAFNALKVNTTCPICDKEKRKLFIESFGIKLLKDGNRLQLQCSKGHVFEREYCNFKKCTLCPVCNPSTSSFEKEISELLTNYNKNDRNILDGKELDFYLPEYNLAIECNGDYWHSESNGKDKNYHLNKTNKCLERGIQLLHIFESSWIEKKDIWTSIINNKLGKSKKIMARKCILKEVPKTEEKEFLDENHLQGFTGSIVCYGLYFNDELVCLMSFGKPRFTDKYDWELIRLCTKMGMNVIGGASKLINHFHKNNPGSLISYSDRLYSDGSIYLKLGFTFSHYSKPGYYYFKNGIKYSRQQFMKHKLKDKLEKFDPNLTESENMSINGYSKIWDCGQGVWVKESLSKNII